ncbi:MAG: inositol-3-phosphate synthase, partial [Oligoflexia bacterium]|nr:inositol-3-phosphate synthase [Oligoflexia bacterium]
MGEIKSERTSQGKKDESLFKDFLHSIVIDDLVGMGRGLAKPIGSYTQMGMLRLGKRSEQRFRKVKELVPLAELPQLVFGGWDIFPENAFEAAGRAQVLEPNLLQSIRGDLEKIRPMSAVFDNDYVKNING